MFDNEVLPAAAVAAAATTTTTAAAATGALLGLGHVNADGTTVELGTVQSRNGLVRSFIIFEGDETESTRATGVTIADNDRFADLAVDAKRIAQALVVRIPAQTSNKQFLRHISLYLPERYLLQRARLAQSW